MLRSRALLTVLGVGLLVVACRSEQPKVPPPEPEPGLEAVDPNWDPEPGRRAPSETPAAAKANGGEANKKPEFRDGMSVEEALRAVPSSYEYLAIDQEALERPLRDPEAFTACKGAASSRISVRVAVWDGRAVGIDVTGPPALRECVIEQIKKLRWRDQVESINTIQYSF